MPDEVAHEWPVRITEIVTPPPLSQKRKSDGFLSSFNVFGAKRPKMQGIPVLSSPQFLRVSQHNQFESVSSPSGLRTFEEDSASESDSSDDEGDQGLPFSSLHIVSSHLRRRAEEGLDSLRAFESASIAEVDEDDRPDEDDNSGSSADDNNAEEEEEEEVSSEEDSEKETAGLSGGLSEYIIPSAFQPLLMPFDDEEEYYESESEEEDLTTIQADF